MIGLPPTAATQPPGAAPSESARAATAINADFQAFLRMLTVQMQNQNPLNPMDSQEFAVQLATFSGVEQQVRSNQLLEAMSARLGMSELAGWVGMEALSAAPAYLDGQGVELIAPQVPGADRARMIVRNAFGTEVALKEVDPTAQRVQFEGLGADGFPLPAGFYSFEVESLYLGDVISNAPALSYSRVQEARFDAGSVQLMVAGGGVIDSAAVKGLRAPG